MLLENKTVVITGAGSGIGRAMALRFTGEGADTVIADIDKGNAEKVADEVKGLGREALGIKADVTKEDDVNTMIRLAVERFGKIDVLVNNAGAMAGRIGLPFTRNTPEDWDFIYAVNLKSVFLCSKAVTPHFMERKAGNVINLASIAGQIAGQVSPPYSALKAAVITFTQILAKELAPYNVNVNAISPGMLFTGFWEELAVVMAKANPDLQRMTPKEFFDDRVKAMTQLKREQTPEDIANLAVFLASDQAGNITGQTINVDGGIYMH